MAQRIIALGKEYEAKGIKEYSWMFERGNQRYISKLTVNDEDFSYDRSEYERA